jgi:hypothetical protein
MERQMNSQTKKVLALVALIVATGVAVVELTRTPAQADPLLVQGGAEGYAGSRVDAAFQLVDQMSADSLEFPLAEKGDLLPIGCAGPFEPAVAAECMDVAYEVESDPVLETRTESSSILTRTTEYALAGF